MAPGPWHPVRILPAQADFALSMNSSVPGNTRPVRSRHTLSSVIPCLAKSRYLPCAPGKTDNSGPGAGGSLCHRYFVKIFFQKVLV